MNAWSHLPNAAHIDRVLESLKSHPESWCVPRDMPWGAAYDEAWDVTVREVVRDAAYDAARNMVWNAAWKTAWKAARGAVLALITYDDAAKYLDMSSDQLKTWEILSEDPAAVLLLPAVVAYEKIDELKTV